MGIVSLVDVAVHDVLCLWADHETGICWASAEKIKALCPAEISYKSVQRCLAKLERLGWIKRWLKRGCRGNYPTLVCRYFVRDVSMTWLQTSGEKTTDWRDVKFEPVHDASFNRPQMNAGSVREGDHDPSGVQDVINQKQDQDGTSNVLMGQRLSESISEKLKIGCDDEPLSAYVNGDESEPEWFADSTACADYLGYSLDPRRADVSVGFAGAMAGVWSRHGASPPQPGILASKVIDECRRDKALWPPDFQKHRDWLRAAERKDGKGNLSNGSKSNERN